MVLLLLLFSSVSVEFKQQSIDKERAGLIKNRANAGARAAHSQTNENEWNTDGHSMGPVQASSPGGPRFSAYKAVLRLCALHLVTETVLGDWAMQGRAMCPLWSWANGDSRELHHPLPFSPQSSFFSCKSLPCAPLISSRDVWEDNVFWGSKRYVQISLSHFLSDLDSDCYMIEQLFNSIVLVNRAKELAI